MGPFVRKNVLVASATFTPLSGTSSPSSATCVLNFTNTAGVSTQVSLSMTLGADGATWSVNWDSSAAQAGPVSWLIYSSGSVQAAAQGTFTVLANAANNV